VFSKNIDHALSDLQEFSGIMDQYHYRLDLIMKALKSAQINILDLDAVVGRGGLLKPVTGGTYIINEKMLEDLKAARRGDHASNLGAVLAYALGKA
jgi:butyrate kinase